MPRQLIECSHLFKSFHTSLFSDISFTISEGEIIAIIGDNGAGKTTFLQLLEGSLLPDSGHIVRASSLNIGFLSQEMTLSSSLTVRKYLEKNVLSDMEQQMHIALENNEIAVWAELHERFEQLGGYQKLPIEQILHGLKLEASLLENPINSLSSGQKKRIALAKVLIDNPELLLLDEPTNHLDQEMIAWLETTLLARKGATIVVSHNRKFLNHICNHLIEIKNEKLISYSGNYDFYLEEKARILEKQIKAYEKQEEERALLKQKIKSSTFSKEKANAPKDRNLMAYDRKGEKFQKSQQRKLDVLKTELSEIEENLLSHPKPKSILGLRFSPIELLSTVAIELEDVSKSYPNKLLFAHFNKTICKRDRILLTGPNGAGKTTLLECIAGKKSVDSGKIRYAPTAKISYLDQEVSSLPLNQTPIQYFENHYNINEEGLRRQLHMAAIGGAELLHLLFSKLSVGQRKRFALLTLILEKPNVLLLDEPTNHLDLLTIEALEKALLDFEGAILAVSHDATFIEKIGNQKWSLPQ